MNKSNRFISLPYSFSNKSIYQDALFLTDLYEFESVSCNTVQLLDFLI
jgi:hypothetical protein